MRAPGTYPNPSPVSKISACGGTSDKATSRFHTGDLTMNPHLTVRRMALARVRGEAMTEAAAMPLQSEQICS